MGVAVLITYVLDRFIHRNTRLAVNVSTFISQRTLVSARTLCGNLRFSFLFYFILFFLLFFLVILMPKGVAL